MSSAGCEQSPAGSSLPSTGASFDCGDQQWNSEFPELEVKHPRGLSSFGRKSTESSDQKSTGESSHSDDLSLSAVQSAASEVVERLQGERAFAQKTAREQRARADKAEGMNKQLLEVISQLKRSLAAATSREKELSAQATRLERANKASGRVARELEELKASIWTERDLAARSEEASQAEIANLVAQLEGAGFRPRLLSSQPLTDARVAACAAGVEDAVQAARFATNPVIQRQMSSGSAQGQRSASVPRWFQPEAVEEKRSPAQDAPAEQSRLKCKKSRRKARRSMPAGSSPAPSQDATPARGAASSSGDLTIMSSSGDLTALIAQAEEAEEQSKEVLEQLKEELGQYEKEEVEEEDEDEDEDDEDEEDGSELLEQPTPKASSEQKEKKRMSPAKQRRILAEERERYSREDFEALQAMRAEMGLSCDETKEIVEVDDDAVLAREIQRANQEREALQAPATVVELLMQAEGFSIPTGLGEMAVKTQRASRRAALKEKLNARRDLLGIMPTAKGQRPTRR
mmetsp:Transcript_66928/g.160276  ORF Transcript_66928/g.160276 Transcript_66928/m.160276 type:complete len:518 (+) Transcript_66928:58-1611(+)